MQFTISNEQHWENLFKYIKDLLKDKTLNITIETVKNYKTKKQLGFIFGAIITNLQVYYFDATGEKSSPEELKEMLYKETGIYQEKTYPNGKTYFECITLSKMDVNQASEFINNILNWIDEYTDCVLSPDVRYCWVHNITEKRIELANKFLPKTSTNYLRSMKRSFCINCGIFGCEGHHIRSGEYAGTAIKSPDWFSIPLCRDCHELAHRNEKQIIENLKHILGGLNLETFCMLCFDRWLNKRFY